MADETVDLVCLPVGAPGAYVLPGSVHRTCAACGGRVWLAPTGQGLLRRHPNWRVVCWPCRPPEAAAMPPSAAQVTELREALRQAWWESN